MISTVTCADYGICHGGSSGIGCPVSGVRETGAAGVAVDEDMRSVQEVLQPSWGGTCKRGGGQLEHGGTILHFSFQSLPPLQWRQEQEQLKMVGFLSSSVTYKTSIA